MPVGPQETVVVPWASRVLAGAVVAVSATTAVALVLFGRVGAIAVGVPAAALVAALALIGYWFPMIRLDPAHVVVVNPFRTWTVSWAAIRELDASWSLRLSTAEERITVWAAPRDGMLDGARLTLERRRIARAGSRASVPEPRRAADLVQRQWAAYRDAGVLGALEGAGVTRTWHVARLVTVAVLAALTLVALLLPW